MRTKRSSAVAWGSLVAALGLGAGCTKDNPYFCPTGEQCAFDASPDGPQACSTSNDCTTAELPACDTSSTPGVCVQCTDDDKAACTGAKPACGDDHACRKCEAHSECDSQLCLPDGTCADEDDVAYVSSLINPGTDCTKIAPCATVLEAASLASPKHYIKVSSTSADPITENSVFDGKSFELYADPGSVVGHASDGTIFQFTGASHVEIHGLRIVGATTNNGLGIRVPSGDGTLLLSGVVLSENAGGGLSIESGSFDIENSIIVRNGSDSSGVGGVRLQTSDGPNVFRFNTVAYNHAGNGPNTAGVICSPSQPLTIEHSIITSNSRVGAFSGNPVDGGNCTVPATTIATNGDATNALHFVNFDVGPDYDFRLTSDSTEAIDQSGTCSGGDIEGQTRPRGEFCDPGADEF